MKNQFTKSRGIWLETQFPFLPGLEWIDSQALAQWGGLGRLEPFLSGLILMLLYEHLHQDTEAISNLVVSGSGVCFCEVLIGNRDLIQKILPWTADSRGLCCESFAGPVKRGEIRPFWLPPLVLKEGRWDRRVLAAHRASHAGSKQSTTCQSWLSQPRLGSCPENDVLRELVVSGKKETN